MSETLQLFCTVCGAVLPPDAPLGTCASCVVHSAFRPTTVSYHGIQYGSDQENFVEGQKVGQGRFSLVRELGAGGMGVVWLALDEQLSQGGEPVRVALKFLSPRIRSHPEAVSMMREEVLRSRQLRHQRIVSIYDWHAVPGEPMFISMEFIDGTNLADFLREQPGQFLSWAAVAPWVKQLCDALDYAHTAGGTIHRDLKPGNLMLSRDQQLKLADFGLARVWVDHASGTLDQTRARGTPLYMSPQQVAGMAPHPSDDIYSLGATLYELLTGTPPFYGDDIFQQVMKETPQPLPERLAMAGRTGEVPVRVRQAVIACLQKTPAERPASIRELANRLGLALVESAPAPVARPFAPVEVSGGGGGEGAGGGPGEGWAPEAPRASSSWVWMVLMLALSAGAVWWRWDALRSAWKGAAPAAPPAVAVLAAPTNQTSEPEARPVVPTEPAPLVVEVPASAAAKTGCLDAVVTAPALNAQYSLKLTDAGGRVAVSNSVPSFGARFDKVTAGEYTLEAFAARGKAVTRLLRLCRIDPGVTQRVDLNFAPGSLQVYSNERAELTAMDAWSNQVSQPMSPRPDGPEAGRGFTNYALIAPMASGVWRVRLARPYYRTNELQVDITPGGTNVVTVVLVVDLAPQSGLFCNNSVDMDLIPFTNLSYAFWMARTETTRKQFEEFARESANARELGPMTSWVSAAGWTNQPECRWDAPPFEQDASHPVAGVSWTDAKSFCDWLTARERTRERLRPNQSYRLPKEAEWRLAVGEALYPWGDAWPPDARAGNYAGEDAARTNWHLYWPTIPGFNDFYPRTAPVGRFRANPRDFCDLGGNLAEWGEEFYAAALNPPEILDRNPLLGEDGGGQKYRVVRGASWYDDDRADLRTAARHRALPAERTDRIGFRVVLTEE